MVNSEIPAGARARFFASFERGSAKACWPWRRNCDPCGYGKVCVNGRYVGAHRVAYVLLRGSIADGAHVLHNCDKPACVNPRHLRLGTPKDNAQDCIRRGRKNAATGARNGQHTHPERTARGEQIGISRLSEKQVRAIKRLLATGVQRMVLARRFNVAWQTVGNIAAGITWRHVA